MGDFLRIYRIFITFKYPRFASLIEKVSGNALKKELIAEKQKYYSLITSCVISAYKNAAKKFKFSFGRFLIFYQFKVERLFRGSEQISEVGQRIDSREWKI